MRSKKIPIILSILVLTASALITIEIKEVEGKDGAFGGGSGTISDPYIIEDVLDLQAMNDDLSAHYILKNDINATETKTWNSGDGFVPIGNNSNMFTGSLDGKGYEITGLYINRSGTDHQGLFGYVGTSGVVKNVILIDNINYGDSDVGGLIGSNWGVVLNCSISGNVSGLEWVGGLVGYNRGAVSNCYAIGGVSGGSEVGGFVGLNEYGAVSNCYSLGNVGGFFFVGGFVGYNLEGKVSNCFATGNVTRSSGTQIAFGGFVGYNRGKIFDCYSIGRVIYEGTTNPTNKGFAGGATTGNKYEMKGNFWDNQTSGQISTSGNATGKNTTDMMRKSTFADAGWEIEFMRLHSTEVWYIDDGLANAGPDQTVNMGEIVTFNGTSVGCFGRDYPRLGWTKANPPAIINYSWTFYDGGPISPFGISPKYLFKNAGKFFVTLKVTDAFGNWDTDTMTVTVLDTQIPVTNGGPDQIINMGETAHFNASLSRDNVGIISYIWTFTDEVPIVLSGILQSYLFDNAGSFLVTLNITDAAGNWATDTMTVTVKDIAVPIANGGSDLIVDEGTTVTFDWTPSTDNIGIVNFTCSFIDGKSITLYGPTPEYLFNNPGFFIVTLNITDAAGNWATGIVNVTIRDITSPTANAGFDQRVAIGSKVIFDGSLSTDNVGIVHYSWKFNYGGEEIILEGSIIEFKFDKAGTYEGELTVHDAYVNSGKDVIVITVIDTGVVMGTVIDLKGNPVEGANMKITASNGQTYSTTTKANGSFSLVVFHGNFNWTISKEGYKSISGSSYVKPLEVVELDLTDHPIIKEDEKEDNQYIILIIVLAVIVVLILGTVLFILFRKKGLSLEPVPEKGLDMDTELERDE